MTITLAGLLRDSAYRLDQRISGEVLLAYLRLPLVCELVDLHTSATMYPAISEADLLALPIPAIAPAVQKQVQHAVRQSAQARQHATRLLDAAKRAVEIAIEDSEAAALRVLRDALLPDSEPKGRMTELQASSQTAMLHPQVQDR
jgi:hypothetical protein